MSRLIIPIGVVYVAFVITIAMQVRDPGIRTRTVQTIAIEIDAELEKDMPQ